MVDPCIPAAFDGFTVERKFRGAQYHITVKNPDHVQKGIRELTVNGARVEGNVIPFEEGRSTYEVTAVMG
jgi:cellobiose phosphorylase